MKVLHNVAVQSLLVLLSTAVVLGQQLSLSTTTNLLQPGHSQAISTRILQALAAHDDDNNNGGRKLQNIELCEVLVFASEAVVGKVYQTDFVCSCTSNADNNEHAVECHSVKEACCDTICGDISNMITYAGTSPEYLVPVKSKDCIAYNTDATTGEKELPRCMELFYCKAYLGLPCACALSLNGESCSSCSFCPSETAKMNWKYDCSNVEGGEDLLHEQCVKLDNFLQIPCKNSDTSTSGNKTSNGNSSVSRSEVLNGNFLPDSEAPNGSSSESTASGGSSAILKAATTAGVVFGMLLSALLM